MSLAAPPLPRDQFPVADRYCYLDHAGIAAPPTVVAHAVARDASAATVLGSTGTARRDDRLAEVRQRCAALLGAPTEDVTFTKSNADGLRLLAFGLGLGQGDRVLLGDCEYPATIAPWLALGSRGVAVDLLGAVGDAWELPLEAFDAALSAAGGRTRAVVVSWVQYARGWRCDLAALAAVAHSHGALLIADVVQGLGVLPADVGAWGVDAALADGHNWLLGPEGVGLLYLRPDLRDRLWVPSDAGRPIPPRGPHAPEADLPAPTPRFEAGTPNRLGIAGLGASVEMLGGAGIDAVWAHVDGWCDALIDGLTDIGATIVSDRSGTGRSAIVAATFGDTDPATFTERLLSHGVVVSGRGDAVRFAPHAWNDEEDLDAVLRAVRRAWR